MATVCKTVVRKDYTGSNPVPTTSSERLCSAGRLLGTPALASAASTSRYDRASRCSARLGGARVAEERVVVLGRLEQHHAVVVDEAVTVGGHALGRDTRRISRPSATYRTLGSWTGRSTNVKPGPEAYDESV